MRKLKQDKIKHLPLEQFMLMTASTNRGPDPISPLIVIAAGIIWSITALLTL
jgi:hypothetical protein